MKRGKGCIDLTLISNILKFIFNNDSMKHIQLVHVHINSFIIHDHLFTIGRIEYGNYVTIVITIMKSPIRPRDQLSDKNAYCTVRDVQKVSLTMTDVEVSHDEQPSANDDKYNAVSFL